jgi:hypothetical protein
MTALHRNLRVAAVYGTVAILLILSACDTLTETPFAAEMMLTAPVLTGAPCEACAQATVAAALN